ncbi:MAG TPA: hypothetical protein VHB98_23415, partial [Chloroflexota bacterium]|nr:hypothetical protein [Chloroflexota bacterium]
MARCHSCSHRAPLSLVLCLAVLFAQTALPLAARADDSYDVLWHQLDQLVNQRATLMQTLAAADGTVGASLARDLVGSVRPILGVQSQLIAASLQAAQHDPFAPLPAVPVQDRSAGPGVLLGAHQPLPSPGPRVPARTPRLVQQATWRAGLLASSALSLSQAAQSGAPLSTSPGALTGGLALSPAANQTLSDLGAALPSTTLATLTSVPATPSTPSQYATLDGAQDLAPVHSVVVDGRVLRLADLARQAAQAAPPAAVATPPASPTPVAVQGLPALQGYDLAASTQRATFDALAPPATLT